jgi:broad specificity phosphatase PhoE
MASNKAWLITHPETKLDREGRIHGNLDPPLSEAGKYKAKQIARSMKSKSITKIHCSPRQRACDTAKEISKETGVPVEMHSELLPWDLGSMSGAKVKSIQPLLDFFSSRPNREIPGGESKAAVLARYAKFMKQLKAGEVVVGHSQHSLAYEYAKKGGDAAKVPMVGGKAGEIREVNV